MLGALQLNTGALSAPGDDVALVVVGTMEFNGAEYTLDIGVYAVRVVRECCIG